MQINDGDPKYIHYFYWATYDLGDAVAAIKQVAMATILLDKCPNGLNWFDLECSLIPLASCSGTFVTDASGVQVSTHKHRSWGNNAEGLK